MTQRESYEPDVHRCPAPGNACGQCAVAGLAHRASCSARVSDPILQTLGMRRLMAVARFDQVGTTFLQANVTHGVRHHLVRGGWIKCVRPGEFARTKPDNHIRMDSDGTFETAPTGTMTTPNVLTTEATEAKPTDAPKKDKKQRAKETEPEVSAAESAPAAPPRRRRRHARRRTTPRWSMRKPPHKRTVHQRPYLKRRLST